MRHFIVESPYSSTLNGTNFISDTSMPPQAPRNSCLSGMSAHQSGLSTNSP